VLANGPDSPVTYNQGKFISLSCGGLAFICPNFRDRQAAGERLSAGQALTELGLRLGTAGKVVEQLKAAGFDGSPQTGGRAEAAREILFSVGGVACSTARPAAPPPAATRSASSSSPSAGLVKAIMEAYGVGEREAAEMALRMTA
jgi:hypothetical protein